MIPASLARVQAPSAPRFPTPFRPVCRPRPSPVPARTFGRPTSPPSVLPPYSANSSSCCRGGDRAGLSTGTSKGSPSAASTFRIDAGSWIAASTLRGPVLRTCAWRQRPATAKDPQLPAVGGKGQPGQLAGEAKAPNEPAPATGEPGYLGVRLRQDGDTIAVGAVFDGSPATAMGLRAGDVLLSVDEPPVRTLGDVDAAFAGRLAGTKVVLGLRGPDGVRSVAVELGARPGSVRMASPNSQAAPTT